MLCNNKIYTDDLSTNKRLLLGNLLKELQNVHVKYGIEIKNVSIENTEVQSICDVHNNVYIASNIILCAGAHRNANNITTE